MLDVIGDRWTLLLIRDFFRGLKRYNEFLASPESITTSILADRLKKLESYGLITKEPYQTNPVRYEYALTEKGADLLPLVQAMIGWSNTHIPEANSIEPAGFGT